MYSSTELGFMKIEAQNATNNLDQPRANSGVRRDPFSFTGQKNGGSGGDYQDFFGAKNTDGSGQRPKSNFSKYNSQTKHNRNNTFTPYAQPGGGNNGGSAMG